LEELAPVRPDKLAAPLGDLRGWGAGKRAPPPRRRHWGRPRRPAPPRRFPAGGNEAPGRAGGTHGMRADLPEAARERLTRRQSKLPDLMVIEPLNEWRCTACGGAGGGVFVGGA